MNAGRTWIFLPSLVITLLACTSRALPGAATDEQPVVVKFMAPLGEKGPLKEDISSRPLYRSYKDAMPGRHIEIKLPGGRTIETTSDMTWVHDIYEIVTEVSLSKKSNETVITHEDLAEWVEQTLATAKITMPEVTAKKWQTWKTAALEEKGRFGDSFLIADWMKISISLRPKKENKWEGRISLLCDTSGNQSDPLPGSPQVLPGGAIAFSPDGKLVLARNMIFDLASGKELIRLSKEEKVANAWPIRLGANTAAFSPDGKTLALDTQLYKKVLLVDVTTLKMTDEIEAPDYLKKTGSLKVIGFSPDGKSIYLLGDVPMEWSIEEKKVVREFERPVDPKTKEELSVSTMTVAPNGRWLAGACGSSTVYIWNAQTGKIAKTLTVPQQKTSGISLGAGRISIGVNRLDPMDSDNIQISPDGQRITTTGDMGKHVNRWTLRDGKYAPGPRFNGHRTAALSPKEKYLVLNADVRLCGIYLADAKTGKIVAAARPFNTRFEKALWSPDGKWFAFRKRMGPERKEMTLLFKTDDFLRCKDQIWKKSPEAGN